jgi:hypothetical protein
MYKTYAEKFNSREVFECAGCNEQIVRERASDHWQRDPKQIRYFYRYADTGETHSDYCVTPKPLEELRESNTITRRIGDVL